MLQSLSSDVMLVDHITDSFTGWWVHWLFEMLTRFYPFASHLRLLRVVLKINSVEVVSSLVVVILG
jgi:hypothetical protein